MKTILIFFFTCLLLSSCVDRTFDEPPIKELEIPFKASHGIDYLLSKYIAGKYITISEDIYIIGTVIADDKSGNFYKTLVVQDSTGGISIKVNRNGLYTSYPQNSKIGIRCKGLTIADYGGLIQLGKSSSVVNGREQLNFISDLDANDHLFSGPRNHPIVPKKLGINSLRSIDLNTLIELENIEFVRSDVAKSIANKGSGSFLDLNLTDCSNNKILVHTSDFADFADYKTPIGNGSIVAVLGKFNSNVQLYLRDTVEINFKNSPCNTSGGDPSLLTISSIRELYSGTTKTITENVKIRGVVISDKDSLNINAQNLFIEDSSAGIAVRFSGAHAFKLNDEIEISLNGVELSEFKGLLQLNNVALTNGKKVISTLVLTPKIITISELNKNHNLYESSLVHIKNVQLSKASDSKFAFNVVADDNTGSINLFTSANAVFSNRDFPTGIIDLNVIVSEFDDKQILLRNTKDISIISVGSTTVKSIKEIRELFVGSKINISEDYSFQGIVISDKNAMNITGLNIVVQDSSAGITIRFSGNHNFNLGDRIEIKVKGVELSEFSGLLQLNNMPTVNATLISSGNLVIPKLTTIQSILNNTEQHEGLLIQIDNATITKSNGNTYSGACVLTDSSGVIELFTRSQANFANTTIPVVPVKLVGIVGYFNKPQVSLRTIEDVKP
ncbi:MAG: hypothetical protein IT267_12600 [Saprospiraceae bacterium]|nr:hypothetical protein [Saprospiraceae bacterium]